MKERQKKMLRLLLSSRAVLKIDDLAAAFSIANRTVSRDLDVLERWLSLKGGLLERKPNSGIQILTFGTSPDELLEQLYTPDSYLESMTPELRQSLILLFLIFNKREIKISEIANTFFISDTTVWNDLNHIEKDFSHTSFSLERYKGVGISLSGDEQKLRLEFLRVFSNLFSSRIIVPLFYSSDGDTPLTLETNQFKLIMDRLKLSIRNDQIIKLIGEASEQLGCQFTMSSETSLFFYLQISIHRIKSGGLILEKSGAVEPYFVDVAEGVLSKLVDRIFSGSLPAAEASFLGIILKVMETNEDNLIRPDIIDLAQDSSVLDFSKDLVETFGEIDQQLYYLDDQISVQFSKVVSSFITRLQQNIPYWHGDCGSIGPEILNWEQKEEHIKEQLKTRYALKADVRDIDSLLLYFQALMLRQRTRPDHKLRCLVCCFEGIGLAAYLQSRLNREFREVEVVEATAVYKIEQSYLDSLKVNLVLSTYPLNHISTPVLSLQLPFNVEELKKDIRRELEKEIHRKIDQTSFSKQNIVLKDDKKITFSVIMDFISRFRFINCTDSEDLNSIIYELVSALTDSRKQLKQLEKDFHSRETLGPLYFEEFDTRILHCKSKSVEEPVAGIISFKDDSAANRMIFLVAPDPCPDEDRRMLSEITLSFMENPGFRLALKQGDQSHVRRVLMDIYKEFI